jgi:CDP-glucose 4,6-dehydratase
MGGYDPYSNSKGCAELVSAAYRSSFFNAHDFDKHGVAVATVRAGNVIGGGDWAEDRLIPDILSGFQDKRMVSIRNPHAIRPWQHVMEPLRGYLALVERLYESGPEYAEAWNFGPNDDDAKPVGWIVERMAKAWGNDAQWQLDGGEHPHEANYLKLDISKARSRLDWHPVLHLEDALKLIIDWAKQRQAGADIKKLTLTQIQNYQRLTES